MCPLNIYSHDITFFTFLIFATSGIAQRTYLSCVFRSLYAQISNTTPIAFAALQTRDGSRFHPSVLMVQYVIVHISSRSTGTLPVGTAAQMTE